MYTTQQLNELMNLFRVLIKVVTSVICAKHAFLRRNMNKRFLRFTFFLLMYLALPLTATAQVVNIPDPNLRAAIEKALGKASGGPSL